MTKGYTMTPTKGNWFKVTAGPHRGREGVCDLIDERPNGTFYRISNREMIVGRFPADMLEPTTQPVYESQVAPEVRQGMLDLMMGRRAS